MTEAEKIRYAKTFIDKMAKGIDPLTDLPVPEGDTVRQTRISRCLSYVSGLLDRLAEQETVSPGRQPQREAQKPFGLDLSRRGEFPYSDEPIPVSEVVKRINGLAESEPTKKLNHLHVTRWLLEEGVLEEVSDINGKKSRRPTRRGEELGIRTEERQGQNGPYQVILYGQTAQQFLVDHLDGIIALAGQKRERVSTREMQGMPWTRPQEELLAELYTRRVPLSEIAAALKRSPNSIRLRLERLGLMEPTGY